MQNIINVVKKYWLPALVIVGAVGIAIKHDMQKKHKNVNIDSNELILTQEEENAIGKWKDKTSNELIVDALSGDAAGLWMIGMSFMTGGMDFPMDVGLADEFFAKSASLGFAPALDQLKKMYFFDEQNAFLALVYLNLTISEGHTELLKAYHTLREKWLKDGGKKIVDDIEKIAIHKKSFINKAREASSSREGYIRFTYRWGSITSEDVLFDNDFWEGILSGRIATGNLELWLRAPENSCRQIKINAEKAKCSNEKLVSWKQALNA